MSGIIPITNVVSITVATAPTGLADFAVNNLLILTKETPIVSITNYALYLTPGDVATDWGTGSEAYAMALQIFSQSPNILSGGGTLIIAPQGSSETLADAITRVQPLVFFVGILSAGYSASDAEFLAAATVSQANDKLLFVPNYLTASLNSGGLAYNIQAAGQSRARCLLHTTSALYARTVLAPAYASRYMSVEFAGSQTTASIHMKDLYGVLPDTGITQTTLDLCKTIGVDTYVNIGGLSKVFSTGGNTFADSIYNVTWFKLALQVAGFNAIATTSTKLPQTEPGMAVLRGAYLGVLQQAVTNGFLAPGAWNSPTLFGDVEALKRNVLETGFYLYSQPVNKQSQTDRAARKAPLIQIAGKEAGAIHSSSVIVNINA